MRPTLSPMYLFPFLLVLGCSAGPIEFGEEPAPISFEGTWVGQLSSDAVLSPKRLELTLDASGHGTLLVGDTPNAAPTDPARGYPEEAQADAAVASGLLLHLYDGVSYTLGAVDAHEGSLSFEVDALEAFEPICALQTPIATDRGFSCLENSGGGVDRSGATPVCFTGAADAPDRPEVDCLLLFLCSIDRTRGCRCSETSCSASDGGEPARAHFELTLDGEGTSLRGTHRFALNEATAAAGELTLVRGGANQP
jgi:hypothetical protein